MARIRAITQPSGGESDVIYEEGTGTTDSRGHVVITLQKMSDPDFIFACVKSSSQNIIYNWAKDLTPNLGAGQWTSTSSTWYNNFTGSSVSGNQVDLENVFGGWGNKPFTFFAIKKN